MEVIVFTGLQGAGKSTFFAARFADTHLRISLDVLRTRHREKVIFQACLDCRQSCVIDNTNPSPDERARYIMPAKAIGARVVAYYFDVPLEEAMLRNASRQGKGRVPDKGVLATARRLVPPTAAEGFDAILRVSLQPDGTFFTEKIHPPARPPRSRESSR